MCHELDIIRELLGHNFVPGLRLVQPRQLKSLRQVKHVSDKSQTSR